MVNNSIVKEYSLLKNGRKIGDQLISIKSSDTTQDMKIELTLIGEKMNISARLNNNGIQNFSKHIMHYNNQSIEEMNLIELGVYSCKNSEEERILYTKDQFSFYEKLFFAPLGNPEEAFRKNRLFSLESFLTYKIKYIRMLETNQYKLYMPEKYVVYYDESGVLNYGKSLVNGIEIIQQ